MDTLRQTVAAIFRGADPGRSLRQVGRDLGSTSKYGPHVMLARLRSGQLNPTVDQLERIAAAWGIAISISATYVADGRPVEPELPPHPGLLRLSDHLRQEILDRDGACVLCGSVERLEVDHIIPRSAGGGHSPENLRALCSSCHRQRPAIG